MRHYLERFRNLEYLENELETYNREEQEKAEEHDKLLKKMQKRMRAEEMRILRWGGGGFRRRCKLTLYPIIA